MQTKAALKEYPKSFSVLGTSYRKLAVEERELLTLFEKNDQQVLRRLKEATGVEELALISTCNRFELVSVHPAMESRQTEKASAKLLDFLSRELGRDLKIDDFYRYGDREAVRHFFRVAASLDSMVLGESQILSQVKLSYKQAVKDNCAGKYLHHLFQFGFRLAKRVRNNTSIAEKGVSVSYVAVKLAEQIFGELKGRSVLVIGSGQMAELTALHLKTYGAAEIIVANRTLEKALELATKVQGSAISLDDIKHTLRRVDIIISSITHAERPLLSASSILESGRDKSLFLVDLGVPRNFDTKVAAIDDVYLYNIDDLAGIAEEHKNMRKEAAKEAEVLIEYGLVQFEKWLFKVSVQPAIVELRRKVYETCRSELEVLLRKYLSPKEIDEKLGELSRIISGKIAHDLTELIVEGNGGGAQPLSSLIEEVLANEIFSLPKS